MKDMKRTNQEYNRRQPTEVEGKICTVRKTIIHYYDLSSEDDSKLSGEQPKLWENKQSKDDHKASRNKEEFQKALVTKEMTFPTLEGTLL